MKQTFVSLAMILAVLVLVFGSIVGASQTTKVDLTGVWLFSVESAAGTSTPTVTFKQTGEKLTGHYSSQLVGEAELSGTVKGQTIDFTITADVQGTKFQLTYSGIVEGDGSMKGKLSAGEFGDGTFTAKRK
jgi:hypothetical protein